jgi:hypothetical protein
MSSFSPPAWVRKRDGQLAPFEADKISRSLFAATEELGGPDAFLARELADGVVHFLSEENSGATPTTAEVAELVVKVVRELGQPALAEAFAKFGQRRAQTPVTAEEDEDGGPPRREMVLRFSLDAPLADVLSACTHEYTLQNVFTRDLVSAQGDGLLTLTGLDHPDELAACVLGPWTAPALATTGLAAAVGEVRHVAGRCVVLDGPEHVLARSGKVSDADARELVHELRVGLATTKLECVVNLNTASPPSWADDLAEGPLFMEQRRAPPAEDLARFADTLAAVFLRPGQLPQGARIDWHLGECDFQPGPAAGGRLVSLVRRALDGAPLAFAFDRTRRGVALAEGIDRQHPAVLLTVGLHLPRLARHPGVDGDRTRFLHKLGSLARLALSAGVQKREYLRRRERARAGKPTDAPAVTSGFLLDRARLLVAPVGLDAVVAEFTGKGLVAGGESLDCARHVVQRLRDVLRQDGAGTRLDTCLDGPFHFRLGGGPEAGPLPVAAEVAGLSGWDPAAPPKEQWKAAGVLHGLTEGGTLALFLSQEKALTAEQAVDWLRAIWKQTEVVRVRLIHPSHRRLTFVGKMDTAES